MVPFAFPSPAPACERRRLQNANKFFSSVVASGGIGGGGGGGIDADLTVLSGRGRRSATSGGRGGGDARPTPDLEEQLYAVLGALLEASRSHHTSGEGRGGGLRVYLNRSNRSAFLCLQETALKTAR